MAVRTPSHTSLGILQRESSESNTSQSELPWIQRLIVDGRTTSVVVWKLNLLSRCLKDVIHLLTDWCGLDIRVVSVSQRIDLSSPLNHLDADVFVGLADIKWARRLMKQKIANALGVSERTFCILNYTK